MTEEHEVNDIINSRQNEYIAESVRILQNLRAISNQEQQVTQNFTAQSQQNDHEHDANGDQEESHQDTLQLLVSLVQSYPMLWKRDDPEYHKKGNLKKIAWLKIADILSLDGKFLYLS